MLAFHKLRIRNFNFREDDKETGFNIHSKESASKKRIGLIAQEAEEIFPSLISEHNLAVEGQDELIRKDITWSPLIPIMVKAIQELSAKIPDESGTVKVIEKTKVEVVDNPVLMSNAEGPMDWHAIAMALDKRLKAVENKVK